jgi:hypothetical protein
MSSHCEYIRPLLAELVYGEVDTDVAEEIREHLGSCLPCRRHQKAYMAVREELQRWQPAHEHIPHGTTFIAPGPHTVVPLWRSRWVQGLAIAAGFFSIAFLMAAAVNLELRSAADGWTLTTSLWNAPAMAAATIPALGTAAEPAAPEPQEPLTVSVEQILGIEAWLEQQLAERAYVTAEQLGTIELTEPQVRQVSGLLAAESETSDARHERRLGELVSAYDARMREFVTYNLASLHDDLQSRQSVAHSDIVSLVDLLQVDTRRRFEQTESRIDYLGNLVTAAAPAGREHEPEN